MQITIEVPGEMIVDIEHYTGQTFRGPQIEEALRVYHSHLCAYQFAMTLAEHAKKLAACGESFDSSCPF